MNLHGRNDPVSQIDKRDINGHLRYLAKYKAIKAICLTYTTTHRHAVNRMTESLLGTEIMNCMPDFLTPLLRHTKRNGYEVDDTELPERSNNASIAVTEHSFSRLYKRPEATIGINRF